MLRMQLAVASTAIGLLAQLFEFGKNFQFDLQEVFVLAVRLERLDQLDEELRVLFYQREDFVGAVWPQNEQGQLQDGLVLESAVLVQREVHHLLETLGVVRPKLRQRLKARFLLCHHLVLQLHQLFQSKEVAHSFVVISKTLGLLAKIIAETLHV